MTLLQDYGRFGYEQFGITRSGPMDEHAFLWANKLLGNDFNAAQLEICMGGFTACFTKATKFSLCGANFKATLNDAHINVWQSYEASEGDVLSIIGGAVGLYIYLAVSGGFELEKQLSSCSTIIREQLGGLNRDGERIKSEDQIPYLISKRLEQFSTVKSSVPFEHRPVFSLGITIGYIPHPKHNQQEAFESQLWQVSQQINRMGYRLSGEPLLEESAGLLSHGVSMGAIQLPPDGQPIILMKDKQTMGGYPILGHITYLDIALLSQCRPGTKLRFQAVKISDIEEKLRGYLDFFEVMHQG